MAAGGLPYVFTIPAGKGIEGLTAAKPGEEQRGPDERDGAIAAAGLDKDETGLECRCERGACAGVSGTIPSGRGIEIGGRAAAGCAKA